MAQVPLASVYPVSRIGPQDRHCVLIDIDSGLHVAEEFIRAA